MKRCVFVIDGNVRRCKRCGVFTRAEVPPESIVSACRGKKPPPGAGSYLKRFFQRFYMRDDGTCGCEELAAKMDRKGPDWCEKHLGEIVAKLRENAANRGLPFSEWLATALVRRAITAAR